MSTDAVWPVVREGFPEAKVTRVSPEGCARFRLGGGRAGEGSYILDFSKGLEEEGAESRTREQEHRREEGEGDDR